MLDPNVAALGPSELLEALPERRHPGLHLGIALGEPVHEDDTPHALIVACMPEILVKGGDYNVTTTVGAAEVIAAGGTFVAIPFRYQRSTSALIQKIREG